jgi:plastocyanin
MPRPRATGRAPAAARRGVPRRPVALALALAALALPAAGCADDAPPARPRAGSVDVTLDDFLIRPQRVRARAGRITFRAVNRGRLGHTLRVKRGERELVAVKSLLPGESGEDSATFARGEYDLVCVLGNHDVLGMRGTLIVR